jgi:hypothetical protein
MRERGGRPDLRSRNILGKVHGARQRSSNLFGRAPWSGRGRRVVKLPRLDHRTSARTRALPVQTVAG